MITKNPKTQAVNSFIEKVRFLITQKYRLLIDKEETVSAEKVKVAYVGNQSSKPKQPTRHTLLELFIYHKKINSANTDTGENGVMTEGENEKLPYVHVICAFVYPVLSAQTRPFPPGKKQ